MTKKVVYVVEDIKNAQFRYRVSNIKQILENDKDWNVEFYLTSEILEKKEKLNDAALFVIERQAAKDDKILSFIKYVHNEGKKVLFDLDDLIFDYKDLLLLMNSTNSKNIVYWAGYFWGIRRIAKKVDGFIVTNDFLGKKIHRTFKKPYRVIRNFLNKEQIEISNNYLGKRKDEDFVIGYFSGSPTHAKDLKMVEPELISFLKQHNDAKIEVVGYMDFSRELKRIINEGKAKIKKPVNYLKLQEMMAEVDVNIAPLLLNDFTNCKSELKFFEAAIAGTPTIASPSFAFRKAIRNGENGLLAKQGEWGTKLNELYNNRKKRMDIVKQAKKDALKHYAGVEVLNEVKEAFSYYAS